MRHTYGLTVETFNGARRIEKLLSCLEKCDLSKFSVKHVVEDPCPDGGINHARLLDLVSNHPGWQLVTLPQWGNMQGCADYAMKTCETDWVCCVPDDAVPLGDPFKNFLLWAENARTDVVAQTGAIAPTIYHSMTHLLRAGWLPGGCHAEVNEQFYNLPWMDGKEPVQFDCTDSMVPSICCNVNGAGYYLRRDAWAKVGGYDLSWDVYDQEISYSIQLETDYLILRLPTDPWIHAGGCAQNASFEQLRLASSDAHHDESCNRIFGGSILETEQRSHASAREKAVKWQDIITRDFHEMCERTGGFRWRYL